MVIKKKAWDITYIEVAIRQLEELGAPAKVIAELNKWLQSIEEE